MKARIPLTRRTVDGISCPFPLVTLQVQDKYGTYAKLLFRIDTGADFCGIPIALARREQIAFSERKPGVATGLVGSTKKFHDLIRVLIAGKQHDWPCDFIEEPSVSVPEKGTTAADLTPVLGRAGFLDDYSFMIEGGFLVIRRTGALRRMWFGCMHFIAEQIGTIRSPKDPL